MDVLSPTGRDIWSKETISNILDNEKYLGDVVLGKTQTKDGVQIKNTDPESQALMKGHRPAIISKNLFNFVQQEKKRRCRFRER